MRAPQRVLTPAIHSTSATSFSAHNLAATDDTAPAYLLRPWLARGAVWPLLPCPRSAATPDLHTRCVHSYNAPQLLHPPTHRSMPCSGSARTAGSATLPPQNAPVPPPPHPSRSILPPPFL